MGKSLNNFITLKQAFSGSHERLMRAYDPLAIRQLILNSHYRSPLDFSDAALFAAQSGYEKITEAVKAVRKRKDRAEPGQMDKKTAEQLEQLKDKFEEAMNDDLNTAVALSVVFDMVRLTNELLEEAGTTAQTLCAVDDLFSELGGGCLGIVEDEYPEGSAMSEYEFADDLLDKYKIFIEIREVARKNKDFATADAIRGYLGTSGVMITDTPDESVIQKLDGFLKRYKYLKKHGSEKDAERFRKIIIREFAKRYSK
ncbi:MAG: DALR domain-containing protein [Planctomycetota bacterium]